MNQLLKQRKIKTDSFCLLLTAERTFDAGGILRLPSDEKMSTLLTPTGLPIEGGVQGAITDRFGYYSFRTPLDEYLTLPLSSTNTTDTEYLVKFQVKSTLPSNLPPGIYRLRLDFGVVSGKTSYDLNGDPFARRPFFQGTPVESHLYSPLIRASGNDVNGKFVDATAIQPRVPWVLIVEL